MRSIACAVLDRDADRKCKRNVAAVNRTRGSCMASTNFTTKPLRLIYEANRVDSGDSILTSCGPHPLPSPTLEPSHAISICVQ
jgi:hypothetical protein